MATFKVTSTTSVFQSVFGFNAFAGDTPDTDSLIVVPGHTVVFGNIDFDL